MSSGSSLGNLSPKGSSSSGTVVNLNPKAHHGKTIYPAPFWEEKMSANHNVVKLLEHNPDLRLALHRCPTLAGDIMKHPDVGKEVVRDKKLATEIIRRPHLLNELANFHKYTHTEKRKEKIRKMLKRLEEEYIKRHWDDEEGLAILLQHKNAHKKAPSESDNSSVAIGRATLPNIPGVQFDNPAIQYLMKANRMFLRHDVTIQHGCSRCCAKKIGYYNVLNSHARLMYRIFLRHKQTGKTGVTNIRPYELVVKDPDGNTVFVFGKVRDCRLKNKICVEYPKGNVIGYVEERRSCRRRPFLLIKNNIHEAMIQVDCSSRPFLSHFKYHPKFVFQLRAIGAHNVIGKIASEWIDTPPWAFPSERIYGVNFPQGLTVNVKIIIMAAWILVYIKYYSGKLEQCFHHTLTPYERAIIRMVEEESEGEQRMQVSVSSSGSDKDKDDAVVAKYKTHFEASIVNAKKKRGYKFHKLDDNDNNDNANSN